MQGGSSGSPIFDQDKLIMGDLSGGYASNACDNPSPAWYGKIWYSWDQNGTTPATRLKDWLDPGNTGIIKQPGHFFPDPASGCRFHFRYKPRPSGKPVQFTDLTTGNPATAGNGLSRALRRMLPISKIRSSLIMNMAYLMLLLTVDQS